jgi:C4-type Zn-finger protein
MAEEQHVFTNHIVEAVIALVITSIGGVFAEYVSRLVRRQKENEEAKLDQIVSVVKSDEEARKALVLETAAKVSAQGQDSQKQILESIRQLSVRLKESPERKSAIEGLISGYHEQALSQARAQFWFSVIAATGGFLWILYSGSKIEPDRLGTVFGILPGVVMDTVAFLFFRQASETRQRATDLYDRLRKDRQASEAVALVAAIEDPKVKSAVQAQLALHMAGLDPSPIDLTKFLANAE